MACVSSQKAHLLDVPDALPEALAHITAGALLKPLLQQLRWADVEYLGNIPQIFLKCSSSAHACPDALWASVVYLWNIAQRRTNFPCQHNCLTTSLTPDT